MVEEWKEEGKNWAEVLFETKIFPVKMCFYSKVKGLSLPWDIKVTPVSISTADMEVSKDTIGTGSLDYTEIEFEVDMKTKIDLPETTVQASLETGSKTIRSDISETTTQESLEAEITRQGGMVATSKTSMDGMEEIEEVDRVKEETTPESSMESSSLANIGAGLDAEGDRGGATEEEKVLETSKPRTMKVSLEAITEIVEHGEEGTHHHQMDVNTEPPQPIPRRTIYQYLLHHHDHQRNKTNSIINMTH